MITKKLFLLLSILTISTNVYCAQGQNDPKKQFKFGENGLTDFTLREFTQNGVALVFKGADAYLETKRENSSPLKKAEKEYHEAAAKTKIKEGKVHDSSDYTAKLAAHIQMCGEAEKHRKTIPTKGAEGKTLSQIVYDDTPCGRNWAKWLAMQEEKTDKLFKHTEKEKQRKKAKKAAKEAAEQAQQK